jgi:hypothetical protein
MEEIMQIRRSKIYFQNLLWGSKHDLQETASFIKDLDIVVWFNAGNPEEKNLFYSQSYLNEGILYTVRPRV